MSGLCGKHRSKLALQSWAAMTILLFSAVQTGSSVHKCGSARLLLVPNAIKVCKLPVFCGCHMCTTTPELMLKRP